MSIQEAYNKILISLNKLYEKREAATLADMVIEKITGLQKLDRIIHKTISLNVAQQSKLKNITLQLLTHKPIQYVLQEAWFAKLKFFVNEFVLIPRPETEELIDWVCTEINNKKIMVNRALEIGSGSGCISIILKNKNKNITVTSVDISEDAIAVANKNAINFNTKLNFICLNFLEESNWKQLPVFDIIISNPPYIKQSDKIKMQKNVVDFEPPIALFVEDKNSLIFYKKIALFGKNHLTKNGKIFVEINEKLGTQTINVFKNENYEVELRKDFQGKDRMIKAGFPNH